METKYKASWFQSIKMDKTFVKYSPKSMEAIDYMSPGYFNYHLYLVSTDLYFDKPGLPNYRIKGLSLLGKKCSVVTLKMSDKDIEKVIRHEIGHGFGLPHCNHKNCIMNDARGKYSNLKNCNDFKETCKPFAKKFFL